MPENIFISLIHNDNCEAIKFIFSNTKKEQNWNLNSILGIIIRTLYQLKGKTDKVAFALHQDTICGYWCLSAYVHLYIICLHRKFSYAAHSHIHVVAVCLVCPAGEGSLSPRAGLIGVKQATVKSHQRLRALSEAGKLLLGDFLQLHDSPCPCLSHCLSSYPSLLKSLITAQFPSSLFLSH